MLVLAVHAHPDGTNGYALSVETTLDLPEYRKIVTDLYHNLDQPPVVEEFTFLAPEDEILS